MSHYTVGVILKNEDYSIETSNGEEILEDIMQPFDERLQVDPYQKECWCKGRKAKNEISLLSDEKFGNWGELRKQFADKYPLKEEDDACSNIKKILNERDKLWSMFTKDKSKFEKEEIENHSDKDKPDPDCDDCKGIGSYETTYNPNSKWDWYQVGGRWDGMISKDNYLPVSEYILKLKEENIGMFALVTPEGEWIEKGKMGWWAIVSDRNENWDEIFMGVLEKYKNNHIIIQLDCHI